MPATYDPTRGTDIDRARELLGDTAITAGTTTIPDADALHSDPHIASVLEREGWAMGVSWLAAELYARFAQEPSRISANGKSVDLSNLLVVWADLSRPARERVTAAPAVDTTPGPAIATSTSPVVVVW